MKHKVIQGIVHCDRGIPETPRWFSDNRLSVQFDGKGITQVDYHNPMKTRGSPVIFLQRLWSGFRWYIEREGVMYRPEYASSRIWPFGFESDWEAAGATCRFRLLTAEDSIMIQLETPAVLPPDLCFKLEFYKDFGLVPVDSQDLRFADGGVRREWHDWLYDEVAGRLRGGYREWPQNKAKRVEHDISLNNPELPQPESEGHTLQAIGITADFPLLFVQRQVNEKYALTGSEPLQPGRTYSFVINFASTTEESDERLNRLLPQLGEVAAKQFRRYEGVIRNSPELRSPYPDLNDFIAMAPLYHESCKVTERPGAIKAKNTNYWVWGWDGMTSNQASLYWGDAPFIQDMLRFYEETADPEAGIAHCFRSDMGLYSASALPAQSMYITLLHQYYNATGDAAETARRYPFAKRVFERIRCREVQGTGFCEGASLFPDFPAFMHETGSDISSLNNTIYYCGVRSMEALAEIVGDKETRRVARDVFSRIEERYLPLFFSAEHGYVVSSIDADTLAPRDSFISNAVKWENGYCAELMEAVDVQSLSFFESHIVTRAGLREIPAWSDAYDQDANQLHCWWPVTGEYYMRLINEQDRPDLIEQWIGWVSYWTRKLMCPEGIPCYVDTDEPELDRWNTAPGTWHAYSIRGWYQAALHGVVGVDIEAGGLTFHPYSGTEMTLEGLPFRGRLYDIEMRGSGPHIRAIEVAGHCLEGTRKLPVDIGEIDVGRVRVTVHRGTDRPPLAILRGYGLELSHYRYERCKIQANVQGAGTSRLKLTAASQPQAQLDGQPLEVRFDDGNQQAEIELTLHAGQFYELEISLS